MIARSKYCSRDMEVDSWVRNGIMYIRLDDNGDGIYFSINGDYTGSPWEMGYVKGFVDGINFRYGAAATYMPLYGGDGSNIPDYRSTGTDGDHFTLGAEGFDIYVKYNGVEFIRVRDYRRMNVGRGAIQANNGYGFRNVTVNHFAAKLVLSDYKNNIIDPRDFGMKQLQTNGSMAGGSNQLTLSSNPGFHVGDFVIVEIGGESGGGHRGSPGVGGVWPKKSYPNATTVIADTNQTPNSWAYAQDTGDVYYFYSTSWEKAQINVPTNWAGTSERWYYYGKAVPKALTAQITAISGNTLTLSKAAFVATNGANVYYDNSYPLNKLGADPGQYPFPSLTPDYIHSSNLTAVTPAITIAMPSGNYAIGQTVRIRNQPGITLAGAGTSATTLFSPKGAAGANVNYSDSSDSSAMDFTLKSNWQAEGFGFGWTSYDPSAYTVETDGDLPTIPGGVQFANSSNSIGRNLNIIDTPGAAFWAQYSTNVWGYNINVILNAGSFAYIGWQIQFADSTDAGCQDCSVWSPTATGGFESFKSIGTHFIRPTGHNVYMAFNDAGAFTIDGGQLTMTANNEASNKWAYPRNPIVNINTNVGHAFASQGGTINNLNMTIEGYVNANHDLNQGIVINENNPNIHINGGSFTGPNNYPGSASVPQAVQSTGMGTIVDGMRVTGRTDPSYIGTGNANIGLSPLKDGVLKNCIADTFLAPKISNCAANTTKAPTFIYNLAGTALSSTLVKLTWTVPSTASTIKGYQIFRNNVLLGTTATTNSFTDSGLTAGTAYEYRVTAYSQYGKYPAQINVLANSGSVTVTPGGTNPGRRQTRPPPKR